MQEEKMYRIKCGKQYVKFNLDGSVRGCKPQGSLLTESYLKKYPFDIKKAIESGIITIEEVNLGDAISELRKDRNIWYKKAQELNQSLIRQDKVIDDYRKQIKILKEKLKWILNDQGDK